ncbi:MAG: hypothetical protein FJ276_36690, partial [Planctomycetes bacterium]|nr:hypothetical protein [Planctomycetota bacterium]
MVHGDYYSDFQGATFVVQVDDEAVEVPATTRAILRSMDDLVRHGIRVLCVFGTGTQFEASLRR